MVTSDGLNSPTSSAEISDADSIANLAAELVSELSIESATTESLEDMIAPIVQEGEIMLRGESPRLQITFQHVSPIASPIISVITPILTQVGLGSAPSISILYQHNSPIAATVEVESVIEKIIEGIPSVLGGGHRAEDAAGVAEKLVEEAIAKVESGPKK